MQFLWRLMRGGIWRDHRAETLGLAAGLAGIIKALGDWAAGDLSVFGLAKAIAENWPLIAGGLGLATLNAKINRSEPRSSTSDESVAAIADKALRR